MKKFLSEKSYDRKREEIMQNIKGMGSAEDIVKMLTSESAEAKKMADKTWDELQKALAGNVFTLDMMKDTRIKRLYDIHTRHQDYKDYINSNLHRFSFIAGN